MAKVAIIYHYLALYRYPIFNELSKADNPNFSIISDIESTNDIKLIDPVCSNLSPQNGGIRWEFVKNIWVSKDKILWQTGIMKYCISNKFDTYIFLGNPYFLSTWIAAVILKIRRIPFYFWTHGLIHKEKGINKFIKYSFLKLATGLFLYGERAKRLLMEEGFKAEKLHVIYNSLDYKQQVRIRQSIKSNELTELKKKLFPNPYLPQLIFIGRLTSQKKLDMVLQAMQILKKDNILVNMLFVGDGSELLDLKNKSEELGLADNVKFYGAAYQEEEISKLIISSDICVSPGEVGLTAMHALGYGTPVITHDNFDEQMPEFEAITPKQTGDFFKQNDVVDLADKISCWLQQQRDREAIRKKCFEIIQNKYNPDYQRDKIIECISDVKK